MDKDEKQLLYIEIPSDFVILPPLRESMANLLGKFNLKHNIINDVLLSLNEVIANVIEHSYEFAKGGIIILKVYLKNRHFHFVVRDFGKSFDGNKLLKISAPSLKKRGLGIYLIKKMMTDVYYADVKRGNELHLIKEFD